MRKLGALMALVLPALPASALADAAVEVRSSPRSFSPSSVSIGPGEKVTWTWTSSGNHSVTPRSGSTEPPDSDPGTSFPFHPMGFAYEHTFSSAGCFQYQCKVHTSMQGEVSVGGVDCSSAPPPPGSPPPGGGQYGQPPPGGGQYGQPPPTTGGAPDTAAPILRSVRARPAAICVKRSDGCRRPGLLLSFRLSEAARVVARIQLLRRAQRSARTVRRLRIAGRRGANRVRFSGRGLKPGSYRVRLSAEDAAGNDAQVASVRFRVRR